MVTLAPDDVESLPAATGTAAHTISERALRSDGDCDKHIGDTVETKSHKIVIDDRITESAQVYVDYVNSLRAPGRTLLLEQRFSMAPLDPPFDAGGTCDAIWLMPGIGTVEVVDFKNGRWAVEANGNKQTRTYALLALLNLPRDVLKWTKKIKVTIVQPNAPHEDGRIRSEEFHLADLIEWTGELVKAMHRSKAALDAFELLDGTRVAFEAWQKQYLVAGSCDFCPAAGMCPAYKEAAMDITVGKTDVAVWFEDPNAPKPSVTNMLTMATPEQRGVVLRKLDVLEQWMKDIRVFEKNQADLGNPAEGYGLFETKGHRRWVGDDKEVAEKLIMKLGVGVDTIYNKKLKSPAQIEKVLGAKRKNEIAGLWHQPITGKALLPLETRAEAPMQGKLEQFFEQPE